ncbi:hypothetical protein [Ochrobactrum sp. EDr1-4]|uniref:hypothetical protein n=1 Tax=Ochrobactrum sp. EDr1-4 TaxID=3368622 RepID=UPI003B9ED985
MRILVTYTLQATIPLGFEMEQVIRLGILVTVDGFGWVCIFYTHEQRTTENPALSSRCPACLRRPLLTGKALSA